MAQVPGTVVAGNAIKAGAITIKLWMVLSLVAVVALPIIGYTGYQVYAHRQSATRQHVIVFIAGLNTHMTNCQEATFSTQANESDQSTSGELSLRERLVGGFLVSDPYQFGCNQHSENFRTDARTMMQFSYMFGTMDASNGAWLPKNYSPNDVNNSTLPGDVRLFDRMLDAYRAIYPNAIFTIVGHSLGGVIALEGAYSYVVQQHHTVIDKVMTIDSPLGGVEAAWGRGILAAIESETNIYSGSIVTNDLFQLATATDANPTACSDGVIPAQPLTAPCFALALQHAGTNTITLGNQGDNLFCGGSTEFFGGLTDRCRTQLLPANLPFFTKMYDYPPDDGTIIFGFGGGHGKILHEADAILDIMRILAAPLVKFITPPLVAFDTPQESPLTAQFLVVVQCLWGTINHVSATITVPGIGKFFAAAVNSPTDNATTLQINGAYHLPSMLREHTGILAVDASGDACTYTTNADPNLLPTTDDYLGGGTFGVLLHFSDTGGTPPAPTPPPVPANPLDAAAVISMSTATTVLAGQTFSLFFSFSNTGNTTWDAAEDYALVCDTVAVPQSACMGAQSQSLAGLQVPPGGQLTFYVTLQAPDAAGNYVTSWTMAHGNAPFSGVHPTVAVTVTPSPTVFVGSGDASLYAFDANTGAIRWSFQTNGPIISGPTVADSVVYVGSNDGEEYALGASNGALLWKFQTQGAVLSTAAVANGVVFFGSNDDNIYALDARTGTLIWQYTTQNIAFISSPVVVNGVVYIGSSDDNVYALDAATGIEKWAFTTGNAVTSSPIVVNGTLYIGSEDNNFYALNASTGAPLWKFLTDGFVRDTAVVANNVVYIGSGNGTMYALATDTGKEIWSFGTGNTIIATSILDGNVVYVGSGDGTMYALNTEDGSLRWKFQAGDSIYSSPILEPGYGALYFGSDDQTFYAVDADTGVLRWKYATGGIVQSNPAIGPCNC